MHSPGGFVWWYADIVDPKGDGMVLIWSYGLPFLPGSRQAPTPAERPALNLVLYREGRPAFYALQQHATEGAPWKPETWQAGTQRWRFGDTSIALEQDGVHARLSASLDVSLPAGQRLRGQVDIAGSRLVVADAGDDGVHAWSPTLAACDAQARLSIDDQRFELRGRGYVDSNASARGLAELGIADWHWGRLALPERELIYFMLEPATDGEPTQLLLEAHADGSVIQHTPAIEVRSWARARYGLRYPRELSIRTADIALDVSTRHVVDDGPFYLRMLVDGACGGQTGRGIAERLIPDRVDVPWQRPLVRMRVHQPSGGNSMWLPLFSGSGHGRVGRLLRSWLPSRRAPQEAAS